MFTSKSFALLLTSFGLTALCLVPAHAQSYMFKDLGTFHCNTNHSNGACVNNLGQVVGYSYTDVAAIGFVSAPDGGSLLKLGTLGGYSSNANGINDAGQATGYADIPGDAIFHAFFYTPGKPLKDLGSLGGDRCMGLAVNDSGQVVGSSRLTPGENLNHAFISGPNGGALRDLGTLGGDTSCANAINSTGQVTGSSTTSPDDIQELNNHAFLSGANGGSLKDLGTLGGHSSFGVAVNDLGQVAGNSYLSNNNIYHAFASGADGGPLFDLGTLGGVNSGASGINNAGEVVGYSSVLLTDDRGVPINHAFLYVNGTMLDLNNLIAPPSNFYLERANSISNNGLITGVAVYSDGSSHAFLLTPVAAPEVSAKSSIGRHPIHGKAWAGSEWLSAGSEYTIIQRLVGSKHNSGMAHGRKTAQKLLKSC